MEDTTTPVSRTVDDAAARFMDRLPNIFGNLDSIEPVNDTPDEQQDAPPAEEPNDAQPDDTADDVTPEPAPTTPVSRKIKLGEDELEVMVADPNKVALLDELDRSLLRQQDYTRKTQAVAEQARKTQAQAEEYAQRLAALDEALKASTPAEPDWDKLRAEVTPEEFAATFADWQLHKKRMDAVASEREAAEAKVAEAYRQRMHEHLAEEQNKLVLAVPEWKDEAKRREGLQELATYAMEQGYAPEDLQAVTDHRVMLLLRKAMLFDRASKAPVVPAPTSAPAPTARPSAGGTTAPKSPEQEARTRLKKTGTIDAAADVFLSRIKGGKL